jgi:glycine/D-amino acid oxidase-like deaminating enzyme/nitrite reductase/ring-hydroxylating ferredoxin subunit
MSALSKAPFPSPMDTTPYWIDSAALPRFPKLEKNLEVDAVVIGGGITGITAAYLLKQSGKTVALLERERCARVDTAHTTAHLTAVTDLRLQHIVKTFGRDAAKAVWDAGSAAIDQIVKNIRAADIACDFHWVPGFLHAPLDGFDKLTAGGGKEKDRKELAREVETARDLGIAAEFVDAVPFFELPGIKFSHQAIFHPRKYLAALVQHIPGDGCHVFENSETTEAQEKPLAVRANDKLVRCRHVIMATHTPLIGIAGLLGATLFQSKLALYTSYAIGAKIPPGKIPQASFWDTAEPYNYLRVENRRGFDYAIFGGEDHKTGQEPDTEGAFRRLEARFQRFVRDAEIDHRWSGQVIETNDGLPFIGELAEHQYGATGFAGNGMTFGTLGAMMMTDAVLKRKNPWVDLFDPGRKKLLGGTWSYLTENLDYPYYLLRDWVGRAEGRTLRALKRSHGKILNLDGKKVAAYRDEHGKVTLCSPVCTHLKCIVGWNDAEHTWDCPCHGSRFKPTGEVIAGPAEEPLRQLPDRAGE